MSFLGHDMQDTYLWPFNSCCCLMNSERRFVGPGGYMWPLMEVGGGSDAITVILLERRTEDVEM